MIVSVDAAKMENIIEIQKQIKVIKRLREIKLMMEELIKEYEELLNNIN